MISKGRSLSDKIRLEIKGWSVCLRSCLHIARHRRRDEASALE
jgi:hypothetical protein